MPHRDKIRKGYAKSFIAGVSVIEIRMMPYPPSFRRIAARTMDPAIGASTWALGSQRWVPYRGILTIKARRQANHHSLFAHERGMWLGRSWRRLSERVPV